MKKTIKIKLKKNVFSNFSISDCLIKKAGIHAINYGNVRTSRVAIKATPTDVARMMFKVVRENETAGRPDSCKKSDKGG